jgi:hypothetical protein
MFNVLSIASLVSVEKEKKNNHNYNESNFAQFTDLLQKKNRLCFLHG